MSPEEIERSISELTRGLSDLTSSVVAQTKMMGASNDIQAKEIARQKKENEKRAAEEKAAADRQEKIEEEVRKNLGLKKRANKDERDLQEEKNKIYKEAIEDAKANFKSLSKEKQKELLDTIKTQRILQAEKEKSSKLVDTLANPAEGIKDLTGKMGSFLSVTDLAKENLIKMGGGGAGVTIAFELLAGVTRVLGSAVEGATKAFITMNKAIYNGERGQKVAAKGVTEFTRSVTGAVSSLGSLAIGIGAFLMIIPGMQLFGGAAIAGGLALKGLSASAETLAEINEAAAERQDKLLEIYRGLSDSGIKLGTGMETVAKLSAELGMTTKELENFKNLLAQNSQSVKMLGLTMGQGAENFSKVAGELVQSGLGATLEKMGVTADVQREETLKFMALQQRNGMGLSKNVADITKAAGLYVIEMEKTAALTGLSRKEQEQAREAVMKVEELRAAQLVATQEGDRERLKELQAAERAATKFMALGDNERGLGILQAFGAGRGGQVVSTESAMVLQSMPELMESIRKGESETATFIKGSVAAMRQFNQFASGKQIGADVSQLTGRYGGRSFDVMQNVARMVEEGRKQGKTATDIEKEVEEYIKKFDQTTSNNIDLQRKQQYDVALKQDQLMDKFSNSVNINSSATDLFMKAVRLFTGDTGEKPTFASGSQGAVGMAKRGIGKKTDASGRANAMSDPRVAGAGLGVGGNLFTVSQEDLANVYGLKIKEGDVQRQGGQINEILLSKAKQIQEGLPEFSYFSGFDDRYHEGTGSAHARGNAVDFVLDGTPSEKRSKEIIDFLSGLGLNARDEYRNPSSRATAGHIHAELKQARFGGIFDGPTSGYPVMLHGKEAVVPEQTLNTIKSMLYDVRKEDLSSALPNNTIGIRNDESVNILKDLYAVMSQKLDAVVDKLSASNDIQNDLLRESRV